MSQVLNYEGPICGRCYNPGPVHPANCKEKPESLAGQPVGQYHCPDCGAMVMAGVPHPPLCITCLERRHPGFDAPKVGDYFKGKMTLDHPEGMNCKVYHRDGREIKDCTMADSISGIAEVYARDKKGKFLINYGSGEIITKIIRGKIRIRKVR